MCESWKDGKVNGWVVGGRGGLVFYADPVTKDVYQDKADNRVNNRG